jgi:hypothetical protein
MLILCPRTSHRFVRLSEIITVRKSLKSYRKNCPLDYFMSRSWIKRPLCPPAIVRVYIRSKCPLNLPESQFLSHSSFSPKITVLRACFSESVSMSSSYSGESQSESRSRSGCEEDRARRFKSGMPVQSRSETGRSSSDGESNSPPSPQPSRVEPRRKLREDRLRNPVPAPRQGRGRGRGKGKALDGQSRCAVDAVEDYRSSIKDLSLVSSLQSSFEHEPRRE